MHESYDHEIIRLAPGPRWNSTISPRLGVVGGGQLAKMTALAGLQLGCDVVVLERNNYSPAANLASHSIVGDWNSPEALVRLATQVDVVTLENEFVEAAALEVLEEQGFSILPRADTVRRAQDKLIQKETVSAAGVPVPRFQPVATPGEVEAAGAALGWPLMLKARRNGYDGKGNATVDSPEGIDAAWQALRGGSNPLYVEEFCPFQTELAVILTRARDGSLATYPLVETCQRDHICHEIRVPAGVPPETARAAIELAQRAVLALDGVGSFGVEMFLLKDGTVLFNELAPRVHNSGHYTIEACVCSQFENHVRAVMGWPLGSSALRAPAAAMVNLLGESRGVGRAHGLDKALAVPGAHVHVYGKAMAGKGRKMGHVTALGARVEDALATARRAAEALRFGAG